MNSPTIASFKFSITSPIPNNSFSSGHIKSSLISIPKTQFQLRPHHIQCHLHSQTTVSTQVTSHPVPFPFPNHSFSSSHITSSSISIPKSQFKLRSHYNQSHLHSQTTVPAQATLHPVPSPFPNHSFSSSHITSSSISIPKPQFKLRSHYNQSNLHSQTTVPAQATSHPVPSLFPNHSFSSGHITSSPISIPKPQFQLRPHHI